MSTVADLTIPEELRAAAARLRDTKHHGVIEGDCTNLEIIRLITNLLRARQPLADLLEEAADEVETVLAEEVTLGPDDTYDKAVLDHRGEIRADLTHALSVARAVNGGSR